MEGTDIVINNFFTRLIQKTYLKVLSSEEISERVAYISEKYKTVRPISLYKCILYISNETNVSRLALDYRLSFASNNWKQVFEGGNSVEIDSLPGASGEEIRKEVINQCVSVNKSFYNIILSKDATLPIAFTEQKSDKNMENIPIRVQDRTLVRLGNSYVVSTLNQICYSIVFNKNFKTGEDLKNGDMDDIDIFVQTRVEMMRLVKTRHENISHSLTNNTEFFA